MEQIRSSVKVVGSNGQISLGKEFAGRQVIIEGPEQGVWKIRTAMVIPENELWMHSPSAKMSILKGMQYTLKNAPIETSDFSALLKELEHGSDKESKD